jgi:hypothetical protein
MDQFMKDRVNTDSLAYGGGKLGAEIAGTLGVGGALSKPIAAAMPRLAQAVGSAGFTTGAAPVGFAGKAADLGLRGLGGGITGGVSAGLINPEDAGTGAAFGAALPGALQAAGKVGSAVGNAFRPEAGNVGLARSAVDRYGIPLSVSDIASSPMVKGARSFLDDVPVIGRSGANQTQAKQDAFNKAVGGIFGSPEASLTAEVMDQAKNRIGGKLDAVWNSNALQLDGDLVKSLQSVRQRAANLNPEQGAQVDRVMQTLLSKVDETGAVPGGFVNNWQSELRMIAESEKGLHKSVLGDLRRAVLDGFKRSVPDDQAQALSEALKEYKAYKTVRPLMDKAEVGTAGRQAGNVPAALLPEAVRQSYTGSLASNPFGDLPQIGSQFVADRVARTGGSSRAMVQNSALGGGLALGAWANPLVPLTAVPAAFGLEGLLSSPGVAKSLLASRQPGLLDPALMFGLRAFPALTADQ